MTGGNSGAGDTSRLVRRLRAAEIRSEGGVRFPPLGAAHEYLAVARAGRPKKGFGHEPGPDAYVSQFALQATR